MASGFMLQAEASLEPNVVKKTNHTTTYFMIIQIYFLCEDFLEWKRP